MKAKSPLIFLEVHIGCRPLFHLTIYQKYISCHKYSPTILEWFLLDDYSLFYISHPLGLP